MQPPAHPSEFRVIKRSWDARKRPVMAQIVVAWGEWEEEVEHPVVGTNRSTDPQLGLKFIIDTS